MAKEISLKEHLKKARANAHISQIKNGHMVRMARIKNEMRKKKSK